ncbi:MAG: hypothetical protein KDK70_42415, partial [Myxococcales bacterium]|nr:hypothetical protein [Myxococcales bacterium]
MSTPRLRRVGGPVAGTRVDRTGRTQRLALACTFACLVTDAEASSSAGRGQAFALDVAATVTTLEAHLVREPDDGWAHLALAQVHQAVLSGAGDTLRLEVHGPPASGDALVVPGLSIRSLVVTLPDPVAQAHGEPQGIDTAAASYAEVVRWSHGEPVPVAHRAFPPDLALLAGAREAAGQRVAVRLASRSPATPSWPWGLQGSEAREAPDAVARLAARTLATVGWCPTDCLTAAALTHAAAAREHFATAATLLGDDPLPRLGRAMVDLQLTVGLAELGDARPSALADVSMDAAVRTLLTLRADADPRRGTSLQPLVDRLLVDLVAVQDPAFDEVWPA